MYLDGPQRLYCSQWSTKFVRDFLCLDNERRYKNHNDESWSQDLRVILVWYSCELAIIDNTLSAKAFNKGRNRRTGLDFLGWSDIYLDRWRICYKTQISRMKTLSNSAEKQNMVIWLRYPNVTSKIKACLLKMHHHCLLEGNSPHFRPVHLWRKAIGKLYTCSVDRYNGLNAMKPWRLGWRVVTET